jgi:chitodextrinase
MLRHTVALGRRAFYASCAILTFGGLLALKAQTPGLVAAYSFNEGTGSTVSDTSGHGLTGTVQGATWSTSGKYGAALSFNGTSALVAIADAAVLHLTTGMTLEAWVNSTSVTNKWRDVIYKGNDNYFLEGTSTNSSRPAGGGTWGSTTAEIYGTAALTTNAWTHLAFTYDGYNLRLYVNGVQASSAARTGNMATSTNPLQIGGDSIYGQYFNGLIDEVRVYNVALTQAQIQSDMNSPIGPSGPDTQAPTAPTSLAATAFSPTQINLSWAASTDNVGVTGYRVESCLTASCTFTQIATTAATSYNNTGLAAGAGYSYRVHATDAAGNLSSFSNLASATTPAVDTQPPTAPGNLIATSASASQINLSWTASTDNVGIHGYSVERCLTTSCTFIVISSYTTSTIFNDSGLTPGTGYSYRVQASDSVGNLSPYSNMATATTPALDTGPPTAPANLTAAPSANQISLSWTASTDNVAVTNYLVERCQGSGCSSFGQIGTSATNAYNDTGLAAGVGYSYRVRATDAAANLSSFSNVASATTPTTIPGLVAAFSFNEGPGTTVVDSSGNGNNGTIANATWSTSGKYASALVFNGTNALVTVPDAASLHLTTSMTLEAWVNPSAVNSVWRDVIYKGNDNYYLEGSSGGGPSPAVGGTFGGANANVYGSAALALNTWAHLAATYDGTTLRLYVNGTQVSSVPRTGSIATSSNPLQIGGDGIYGQYFNGLIDEVRVYNVALTQAQIQSDMNSPIGPVTPSPLVTFSSANVVFGNQATGTSSPSQNVTMTNTGAASLTISRIAVTGVNSADFAATNDCGTSLAPAASCTISITFTPTTTGTRGAAVAVTDNGPLSPQTINLTGTGAGFSVAPRVTVLTYTMTQAFTVVSGIGTIVWSVDGVAGGSSASGTISSTGLYVPPASAGTHIVTATTSTSQSANATVYVSNYPGTFTFHNDNIRTGQNLSETVLTPANVNSQQFGKLFSYTTDGISHASPLYVANVTIPGKGSHNVVYVATEHDTVYAFDADGLSAAPLWQVSFINPTAGITTVPPADTGETGDIAPEIGITGTPVIDPVAGTLYLVVKTKEVSGATRSYPQRLHALDITTGAERFGSPVVVQASVPGTGDGSSGGQLPFNSLRENQRPALLLSNGVIYIGFASHGDRPPYHGWVLGYNATTLQQLMAYCDTPNGTQGGIWQSGMGLAADAAGNVYFMTGNGTFDANTGGLDYGDSFVKLSPSGAVLDYFTSRDQDIMNNSNWDLASSGTLLLPDQPGAIPHLLLGAGKTGTIYLVNRDNMGHYNSNNDNQIVQSLVGIFPNGTPEPGNYSSPVYFSGSVYFSPVNDTIKAFRLTNGLLTISPTSSSAVIYPYPGGWIALSANGNTNGILWAIQRNDPGVSDPGTAAPGILRAYLATDLSTEIYNSSEAGTRDALDYAAKFTIPLVANGKVFVLTNGRLTAFGLFP